MLPIKTIADLDRFEDALIQTFKQQRAFQKVDEFSTEQFFHILLQRRFLSLAFTPVYDLAIDGLTDPKAKQIARRILREEYPGERGTVPSHREDLMSDLIQLGLPRKTILKATPTTETIQTLQQTFALFVGDPDDELYQVKLLTILRFWGEVLISAEYEMLWRRMQALGLGATGINRSLFYYLHFIHDAKQKPLTHLSLIGSTHSDLLAVCLKTRLISEQAIAHCAQVEEKIVAVKTGFYEQFL
jgi:hypothetical protein